MITYAIGDATNPQTDGPAIIAHVCNDQGAWGKGFVLAVSNRWPQTRTRFCAWAHGIARDPMLFALGQTQFVQVQAQPLLLVANMVAQHGIRSSTNTTPIQYYTLEECLDTVAIIAKEFRASLHLPRIGCGLAGGSWTHIEPILHRTVCATNLPVTVYDLPPTDIRPYTP